MCKVMNSCVISDTLGCVVRKVGYGLSVHVHFVTNVNVCICMYNIHILTFNISLANVKSSKAQLTRFLKCLQCCTGVKLRFAFHV